MRHYLVIGHPENRRVRMFCDAAIRAGHCTTVLPWKEVLADPSAAARRLRPGMAIRIESPGENTVVEHQLIDLGATCQTTGATNAEYSGEFGRIENGSLWYAGFRKILTCLKSSTDLLNDVQWMNHPDDIAVMFHKTQSQSLLHAAGTPVPQILGTVHSYHELTALMRQHRTNRVFLKLPHSSSASGVVALQTNGRQVIAQTSVEMQERNSDVRLYNSLDIHRYTSEVDIQRLVNALAPDGLHVEKWIPKAGIDGKTFDLRILVIRGRARHAVVRTSRTPMTNLHLGNHRGDLSLVRRLVAPEKWQRAMETCESAAARFPRSLYVGIDLMFSPGFRRHYILEVNAFGDLLPSVLNEDQSTYEAEIAAMDLAYEDRFRSDCV